MSAESPRKPIHTGGHIVVPQPVSDRTIIESVAGFISDVVPQGYSSFPLNENREVITWARFEYADINDPSFYPDSSDDRNGTPPLLLILGYGSGVQVWTIPANGEATEVLSWRQGIVRTLRILPTPEISSLTDNFAHKRPLVALCDSAAPGPSFCSLSFISLRDGDQVKSIKFKNPISDVIANRRSVIVTFPERIAIFNAATLEDQLTITTCYPCPGPNPNPVALGSRWLAYADRKLLPSRRSSGGTEGEGVQSYTAAMLHAAKSLGKGLRGLGETVASSLTGGSAGMGGGQQKWGSSGVSSSATTQQTGTNATIAGSGIDINLQPGIVTIIDTQGSVPPSKPCGDDNSDLIVAHFSAHNEAVVALSFDPSGMLLLTADRRGHDFHVFRIQPHPGGPSLAAVHHLYTLHRGDTSAKVQDITFSADSRWVAVSTLRGTTHVFPITPYGGPVGIRTHATPHVVNRLSRFHRSAGLTGDGRNSPVPEASSIPAPPATPYRNPRLPPYPHPTVVQPLAQIRQPGLYPSSAPTSPSPVQPQLQQQGYSRNPPLRRNHSSASEDIIPLRVAACFAAPRAWLVASPTISRESSNKACKRAVDSLFVMACHGSLIEYDLEPRHLSGIPKEKVCDDTPVELEVKPKAQWLLLRPPVSSELVPPLPSGNPLLTLPARLANNCCDTPVWSDNTDEHWLSQVEIVTHAGPHRRLWMGPQFTFKTYTNATGNTHSAADLEAVDIGVVSGSRPARSNPVNMPLTGGGTRPLVPVLIESGSCSSYEQSPRLMETYGGDGADSDGSVGPGETQLREDLADAMMENPGALVRETGRRLIVALQSSPVSKRGSNPIGKVVNPVGTVITVSVPSDEEANSMDYSAVEEGSNHGSEIIVKWPTIIKEKNENISESCIELSEHGREINTKLFKGNNCSLEQTESFNIALNKTQSSAKTVTRVNNLTSGSYSCFQEKRNSRTQENAQILKDKDKSQKKKKQKGEEEIEDFSIKIRLPKENLIAKQTEKINTEKNISGTITSQSELGEKIIMGNKNNDKLVKICISSTDTVDVTTNDTLKYSFKDINAKEQSMEVFNNSITICTKTEQDLPQTIDEDIPKNSWGQNNTLIEERSNQINEMNDNCTDTDTDVSRNRLCKNSKVQKLQSAVVEGSDIYPDSIQTSRHSENKILKTEVRNKKERKRDLYDTQNHIRLPRSWSSVVSSVSKSDSCKSEQGMSEYLDCIPNELIKVCPSNESALRKDCFETDELSVATSDRNFECRKCYMKDFKSDEKNCSCVEKNVEKFSTPVESIIKENGKNKKIDSNRSIGDELESENAYKPTYCSTSLIQVGSSSTDDCSDDSKDLCDLNLKEDEKAQQLPENLFDSPATTVDENLGNTATNGELVNTSYIGSKKNRRTKKKRR